MPARSLGRCYLGSLLVVGRGGVQDDECEGKAGGLSGLARQLDGPIVRRRDQELLQQLVVARCPCRGKSHQTRSDVLTASSSCEISCVANWVKLQWCSRYLLLCSGRGWMWLLTAFQLQMLSSGADCSLGRRTICLYLLVRAAAVTQCIRQAVVWPHGARQHGTAMRTATRHLC